VTTRCNIPLDVLTDALS